MIVLEPFTAEICLYNLVYWLFEGLVEELPTVCVDAEPSLHRLGGAWSTPAYTCSTRVRALVVLEFPCLLFVTSPSSARENCSSNSTLPYA
jgi:hypothetical protein